LKKAAQKLLLICSREFALPPAKTNKSFLARAASLLFFKKEVLA
jgi:hypothetical protein